MPILPGAAAGFVTPGQGQSLSPDTNLLPAPLSQAHLLGDKEVVGGNAIKLQYKRSLVQSIPLNAQEHNLVILPFII